MLGTLATEMQPLDCPDFEYEAHPNHRDILPARANDIVQQLRRDREFGLAQMRDSRRTHKHLFHDLTPPLFRYYAGNYRGSNFRCLRHYEVGIEGDLRVGSAPDRVHDLMDQTKNLIKEGIEAIDLAFQQPDSQIAPTQKLKYLIMFAARIFTQFLTIHPYANGNGHTARFIVWAMLGRYGFWPERWPIDPGPKSREYDDAIKAHRSQDFDQLHVYLLRQLIAN